MTTYANERSVISDLQRGFATVQRGPQTKNQLPQYRLPSVKRSGTFVLYGPMRYMLIS